VGVGKDYTLFSTIDGIVVYQKKADRSKVGLLSTHSPGMRRRAQVLFCVRSVYRRRSPAFATT
jgi:hypothetical protein